MAEEEMNCQVCDQKKINCYCRMCECSRCGEISHRYNMVHPRQDENDFYELDPFIQDEGVKCKECVYIDTDDSSYETESDIESEEYNADDNSDISDY